MKKPSWPLKPIRKKKSGLITVTGSRIRNPAVEKS